MSSSRGSWHGKGLVCSTDMPMDLSMGSLGIFRQRWASGGEGCSVYV